MPEQTRPLGTGAETSAATPPPRGCRSDLETPALCVDLDRFEFTARQQAAICQNVGKQWRPLVPPLLAGLVPRLIAAGAQGYAAPCHQSISGLTVPATAGILIHGPVVGARCLRRLLQLGHLHDVLVSCDHYVQAEALSAACVAAGGRVRLLVEINLGLNQSGVRPGWDAVELAEGLQRLPNVDVVGVTGHAPAAAATSPDADEIPTALTDRREKRLLSALSLLEEFRDNMARKGLACPIVSAGPGFPVELACAQPAVTEVQGSAALFPSRPDAGPGSFHVLSTVLSRPKLERGVIDAGRLAVGEAEGLRVERSSIGRSFADARVVAVDLLRTTLELGPESQDLVIGETVEVAPTNLWGALAGHRWLYGVRQGRVEEIWPLG
ncbi:alanine racemase [Planctomicrobium sp. SH664]|uniref:alanine racemase n=1 Tax=Planctomicrobium sp. SH664 TaxID=3448125 RepID=UPI003F5AF2DC